MDWSDWKSGFLSLRSRLRLCSDKPIKKNTIQMEWPQYGEKNVYYFPRWKRLSRSNKSSFRETPSIINGGSKNRSNKRCLKRNIQDIYVAVLICCDALRFDVISGSIDIFLPFSDIESVDELPIDGDKTLSVTD